MRNTKKKSTWRGPAKVMAAGLMCLSSFVAPLATDARAADDLTISGAQGGSSYDPFAFSGGVGIGATFAFGATSYAASSGSYPPPVQGADYIATWNGWNIVLGGGATDSSDAKGNGRATTISTVETVTAGNILISSGEQNPGGHVPKGKGGSVTFSASAVTADAVTLRKKNGALNVNIGSLHVSNPSTTLTLDSTSARSGIDGVAINGLSFTGGSGLTVAQTSSGTMTFGGSLNVKGTGNSLNSPIAFNASGKPLTFDLTGVSVGSVLLSTSGGQGVGVDTATTVILTGNPGALQVNQSITLIDTVTGTFTAQSGIQLGRRIFTVGETGIQLFATVMEVRTYSRTQNDSFTPGSWNNANLASGAAYLDWLDTGGSGIDPSLMSQIEAAWDSGFNLGGQAASVALRQLYGEYSSHANTAQSVTASRFAAQWKNQVRSLLDRNVFAELSPDASLSSFGALASPAYGNSGRSASGASRVWGGGFGSWAKQDASANIAGYGYDAWGFALGYEYAFNNCLSLGFAAAYSRGDLKIDDLLYRNRPDIMNFALYGSFAHPSGFYAQGGFGYGHSWNDYQALSVIAPGGVKTGKYGSDAFTADLEFGYAARLPQEFNLIPSLGLEYAHLRNGSWTENVNNAALIANRFASGRDNAVGIPLGLRFNRLFRFGSNGGVIIPEVRAAWVYQAKQSRPSVDAGFAGAPGSARMTGIEPGRSQWRLGAGVTGRFNERVDFRVEYDFDARKGYRGHNVMASMGVAF